MEQVRDEREKKVMIQALTLFVRSLHTNFPLLQEKLADYLEVITSDELAIHLGPLRDHLINLLERMERYDSPHDRTYSIHHNISAEKRNQLMRDLSRDIASVHLRHKKSLQVPREKTTKEHFLQFHAAGNALLDQLRIDFCEEAGVLDAIDFAQG